MSCYWNRGAGFPYCADGSCSYNALRDGSALQYQPFADQYPLIFQKFMSPQNVAYLQKWVMTQGFNAPPEEKVLREFMNRAYTDDMPYGAYNNLDPLRSIAHLPPDDPRAIWYVNYYVDRLNRTVFNRVCRNMSVMKQANDYYQRDISEFRAVMEIDRPINAQCKHAGAPLRLDFLLPEPYHRAGQY